MKDLHDLYNHRLVSHTNVIGRPPVFVHNSRVAGPGVKFTSVYALREEDAKAIQAAGTTAGFRGTVWSQRLWIDFDSYAAAERAESFLKKEGYDYVAYDTGGRGHHVGVLRHIAPSHLLPARDKDWVYANLQGADLSLYGHIHLIRLPGVMHERTGRPKVLFQSVRGRAIELPEYHPKEIRATKFAPQSNERMSIFSNWAVVSRLTGNTQEGDRHRSLLILCRGLKECKVTVDEALWVMLEVNKGYNDPKPEEEVVRIAEWTYAQESAE